MSRLSDLVLDSKLNTAFRGPVTIHSYLEIDEIGNRSTREEHWKWEQSLGRGGFGQVKLQTCSAKHGNQNYRRAVKIIDKPLKQSRPLDYNRELEAIAKFSNDRVSYTI